MTAEQIQSARDAVRDLRDAARDGTVLNHRLRDPLVVAIHDVIDAAEERSGLSPVEKRLVEFIRLELKESVFVPSGARYKNEAAIMTKLVPTMIGRLTDEEVLAMWLEATSEFYLPGGKRMTLSS